jgi:hypothetical protein
LLLLFTRRHFLLVRRTASVRSCTQINNFKFKNFKSPGKIKSTLMRTGKIFQKKNKNWLWISSCMRDWACNLDKWDERSQMWRKKN